MSINENAITVGDATWRNDSYSEDLRGKMHVFFYSRAVPNNFETERLQRPVFVEKVFIKKLLPADSRLVIDRPIRTTDKSEFPIEWARWEQKKSQLAVGTPIEAWSILSETQKAEFKAMHIFTIDQFAVLPDNAAEKIMGFNDLRVKAKRFCAAQKESEQFDKIREENELRLVAQDKEMADLKAALATQAAMIEKLSQPKKRGRKPKETSAA